MKKLLNDPIKFFRSALLVLIILGLAVFFILNYDLFFKSPEAIVEYVHQLGFWGPVMLFFLVILEVIIAPIPGSLVAIASGYAYGSFYGTLITYFGNVVGTLLAFYIARQFGRGMVEKLVNAKKLNLYDDFVSNEGKLIFVFSYALPVLPADIVSFIAGLSSIRLRIFFIFVALGYLPHMLLLNYFGESIYTTGWSTKTIIIGSILVLISLTGLITYFILRRKNKKINQNKMMDKDKNR